MAGEDREFSGEAFPARGIRVGYLPQEPGLEPSRTVLQVVEEGVAKARALLDRYAAIGGRLAEPLEPEEMEGLLEEQARVQDRIEAANAWELDRTLEMAMEALRCPPPDAAIGTISGGERRRVALCRLLLMAPDLLLLDEPTNHLDAESVAWLERHLQEYPGTVVAITHDRYFLDNVARWILELERGAGVLFDDLSFRLPPGGLVGVIGPNGAGKTTLFRLIALQEKRDGGTLRLGDTVVPAWVDQSRDVLQAEESVWQAITGGQETLLLGKRTVNSRSNVASFNFKGPDQQKQVRDLSGGERNRVHLARILKTGANLLLLGEPTNDLDVDTLRALEEALLGFAGCAVVISHDRWFLDRIATHILAFEGDSRVVWSEGNYQEYLRKTCAGARAWTPISRTGSTTVRWRGSSRPPALQSTGPGPTGPGPDPAGVPGAWRWPPP
jgi:ATPase subunit of ABC transporter with duplicated ATPase domains